MKSSTAKIVLSSDHGREMEMIVLGCIPKRRREAHGAGDMCSGNSFR
jgi:hypothetical protein